MSGLILPPGVSAEGYDDRSGLHVAAQAHAAGAVDPPAELERHRVTLEFVVAGTLEHVKELVQGLETIVLGAGGDAGTTTIREWAP